MNSSISAISGTKIRGQHLAALAFASFLAACSGSDNSLKPGETTSEHVFTYREEAGHAVRACERMLATDTYEAPELVARGYKVNPDKVIIGKSDANSKSYSLQGRATDANSVPPLRIISEKIVLGRTVYTPLFGSNEVEECTISLRAHNGPEPESVVSVLLDEGYRMTGKPSAGRGAVATLTNGKQTLKVSGEVYFHNGSASHTRVSLTSLNQS